MARGVNKVILVGNVGQEPETRYAANGNAIVNLSLATSESWKDRQTGEPREKTEWHRIVFFGRLAEIVGEYVHKGSQIYIEGKLQTRKWQDQSGQDRYTTEVVVDQGGQMQLLGSRSGGNAPMNDSYGGGGYDSAPAPQQQAPAPGGAPAPRQAPAQSQPPVDQGFDDVIPF